MILILQTLPLPDWSSYRQAAAAAAAAELVGLGAILTVVFAIIIIATAAPVSIMNSHSQQLFLWRRQTRLPRAGMDHYDQRTTLNL